MKKALKRTLTIIGIAVVFVIVVVAVSIHLFGGRALKFGIETVASETMKVDVTVDDVSFSIFGGWVELKNLKVHNPDGYEHEYLLELGSGKVDMDVKSLLSDEIIIETIDLDGMSVVIEQKEIVHNNLQEILDSLPTPEQEEAEAAEPGKKVHIDKLSITNTTVKVKLLPLPGRADTIPLTLAPIEMNDLGQDDKMTPAKLVAEILRAVAVGIAEKGRDILPDDMIGAMSSVLEKSGKVLTETGKKVLEKGTDVGKDLIEGGKELQENVTEGIKGLFGPKKE